MSRRRSVQAVAIFCSSLLAVACGVDGREVSVSTPRNTGAGAGGSAGASGNDSPDNGVAGGTPGGGGSAGSEAGGSAGSTARVPPGSMLDITAGMPGTPPGCGDAVLADDEACDDGNRLSGDGCSADCLTLEVGFSCAGPRCMPIAACGDGLVATSEQCDDGNRLSGDGCSDRCRVELGKKCQGQPSVCTDTVCGDGITEGAEACDDGNTQPFDGCSARCQKEPLCQGASCSPSCGDGFLSGEECDDGNLTDGDGCSSTCTREAGFTCLSQLVACEEPINGQCFLRVPAVFRDFADTHPDFTNKTCNARAPGAVASALDAGARPVLGTAAAAVTAACLSSAANFADWYTSNTRNATLAGELLLFEVGYVNRYGAQGEQFQIIDPTSQALLPFDGNPLFFPVDSINGPTAQRLPASIPVQYGVLAATPESTVFPGAPSHNFAFTSEMQLWFPYTADTSITLFLGADDDAWVFLNGQLALDLGGIHEQQSANLTINGALGQVTATFEDATIPTVVRTATDFGLLAGNLYTLSIFDAERKPPLSSLYLAFRGFAPQSSKCSAICGDDRVNAGEECDDGRNVGGYGACGVGCVLGPYCGDGVVQPEFGEACDVGPGGDATCRGCRILARR